MRLWRRYKTVGDIDHDTAAAALVEADCSVEEADAIYKLTALASMDERVVIPPSQREMAIEMLEDPLEHKQAMGFGFRTGPARA